MSSKKRYRVLIEELILSEDDVEELCELIITESRKFHQGRETVLCETDTASDNEMRIRTRITRELDQYYMNSTNRGKEYLVEIIYHVLQLPENEDLRIGQIYSKVGMKLMKKSATIDASVRRTLEGAFMRTAPEELDRLYKPYIDIERGVPRNKDFVKYVADKIREENIC
jgi:hypothetical protein